MNKYQDIFNNLEALTAIFEILNEDKNIKDIQDLANKARDRYLQNKIKKIDI